MKIFYHLPVVTLFALAMVGCSDPADKVHKSAATEPAPSASAPAAVAGKEYVIRNEDSSVGFVGSKITASHDGGFKKFEGTIKVADGKIVGSPVIKIDMKSVWSDNDRLTGHLKSSDFFDVEKFPASTFTITSVARAINQYNVTGNLELHGVTKSIVFPAKIDISDEAVSVHAEFAINRKDFNIIYPGKPDDLIRDDVVLKLAIKATPGEARPEDLVAN